MDGKSGLIAMEKRTKAILALADGAFWEGFAIGDIRPNQDCAGEMVFNTSLYGYQEIITDPSYAGQIMCFTNPQIGNVGCNSNDNESENIHTTAVVVRELEGNPSNYRSQESFESFLKRNGIMGIAGVDTRDIVLHLRNNGAQMAVLGHGDTVVPDSLAPAVLIAKARNLPSMIGKEYVSSVTCKKPYIWKEGDWNWTAQRFNQPTEKDLQDRPHCIVIDCGVKRNILRLLVASGFRVSVYPAFTSAAEILSVNPDALFISNGPGDPATLKPIVDTVSALLGKLPIFGICLGHQILGQAVGGQTYKLAFGHRGGNHPVKHLPSGRIFITVQNHGFAVDPKSIAAQFVSHLNLNDSTIEGLELPLKKAFSVQFHPESSPGPHDAQVLFKKFFAMATEGQGKAQNSKEFSKITVVENLTAPGA